MSKLKLNEKNMQHMVGTVKYCFLLVN